MGTTSPLERLIASPVPFGGAALSWLGQSGFLVRSRDSTVMIDPFLAPYEGRAYESSLVADEARGVDLVLCTHEHVDHFDADSAPAIAKASPGAVFVVPTPIVDMVTEAGVAADRVVGMQPGAPLEVAGLRIEAVKALHGVTMEDAYGFGEELSDGLIRFLGYVVDTGELRLYHAGDTLLYPGLEITLREMAIDVAMLPINGRDPGREARDILGNTSEREAAWLADAMGVGTAIPMHHDLFPHNRGYPEWFVESVARDHSGSHGPGPHVVVPSREVPFVVQRRAEP